MECEEMVTAKDVFARFPIKPATFYRMVKLGEMPFHEVTQPWHKKRQLRFLMSEVERILAKRTAA